MKPWIYFCPTSITANTSCCTGLKTNCGLNLGIGNGQGGLACCGPWGCKESDTTERLNWNGTVQQRGGGDGDYKISKLEDCLPPPTHYKIFFFFCLRLHYPGNSNSILSRKETGRYFFLELKTHGFRHLEAV